MNTTVTVTRETVIVGAFWNCCDRSDNEYAGAFDAENGAVVWHALCTSCAYSYRRTVKDGIVARIVEPTPEPCDHAHSRLYRNPATRNVIAASCNTCEADTMNKLRNEGYPMTGADLDAEYRAARDMFPADNGSAPF